MTQDERDQRDLLLRIYEFVQQSAEHHDTLLWEVTAIIWGANTLMLGFAFEVSRPDDRAIQTRVFFGAFLGIFLSILAHINYRINRDVRTRKYKICQGIEQQIKELPDHMKQHCVEEKEYRKRRQTTLHLVMTILFVVAWLAVACQVGHRLFA